MIRRALINEAETLTQLAHAAKSQWGYPEHWIKHWEGALTINPEYIETNLVFVSDEGDSILGFYALILNQNQAELDHMWVSPDHMGSGVGKALFIHAMREAKAHRS